MKELLQQTVENEWIHCQKLPGKTKHIQNKNLDQDLKSWEVSDIKKKQAIFQQKSHMCEVGGAQPPKGAPLFVILLLYPLTT